MKPMIGRIYRGIEPSDYFDVAVKHLQRLTGVKGVSATLYRTDSHLSIEDLASSTVERILNCNPDYVTAAYVKVSAKNVYFDELKRKKRLQYTDVQSQGGDMDDEVKTPIEETLEQDIYDHIEDLKEQLNMTLNDECKGVLSLLIEGHSYTDIQSATGYSARAVQGHIKTIRDKINQG